jgi:hypothetical protein
MVQESFTAMRFGRKPFLIFFSQVKTRHAGVIASASRKEGGMPPCPVVAKTTIGCLNCSKREQKQTNTLYMFRIKDSEREPVYEGRFCCKL